MDKRDRTVYRQALKKVCMSLFIVHHGPLNVEV